MKVYTTLEVRSEHLINEMLLVDLGHTTIVSDHPDYMGGSGKGPSPGELVKGALAASAALEIGAAAERERLPIRSFRVGCGSTQESERFEGGPLPSKTFLSGFVLRVAVVGSLTTQQIDCIEHIARNCPVARTLAGNIDITEGQSFDSARATRAAAGNTYLIKEMQKLNLPTGERRLTGPRQATRVSAEYLYEGRALVRWARSAHLVERRQEGQKVSGSQPETLILAALAACTSVYTARAAALVDAVAEIRVRCSGTFSASQDTDDSVRHIASIEKMLEVKGDLSEKQRDTLAYFAANCALGETLRRRSSVDLKVELTTDKTAKDGVLTPPLNGAVHRELENYLDAAICDDGSCCVPNFEGKKEVKVR